MSMRPIAKRGETVAWASDPFDPKTDKVELRIPGLKPQTILWQSALKMGYWEEV